MNYTLNNKDLTQEILNDDFYNLRRHFFKIESTILIETEDYNNHYELILKNSSRLLKIDFYHEDYIYGQLLYPHGYGHPAFDMNLLSGRTVKIDLQKKENKIDIIDISYFNSALKDEFIEKYTEFLNFSINNINWFLQALSKHKGLKTDILKYLLRARNIEYSSIFLLNKSLTKDMLLENGDLVESDSMYLAQNESDIWDKEILDRLLESCHDDYYPYDINKERFSEVQDILSSNKKLIQDEVLLVEKSELFNWGIISASKDILWDQKKILILKDKLDWNILSSNPYLPWDKDFIQIFTDKWNWLKLSKNEGIDWNTDLINDFQDKLDWSFYTCNHRNLTEDFLEKNIDKWDWDFLSSKHDLPWSLNFLEKFKSKWNWDSLCLNGSIKWDSNFLPKCRNEYQWHLLSLNKGSFWTKELIVKYYFMFNLKSLSQNSGLPWSVDLFNLFKNRNEIKMEYRKLNGETNESYEENEGIPFNDKNNDYYVDPDTDIVFIQGSPSIDQIIADCEAQEDRDAMTDWNYNPDYEDIMEANPLLNKIIWCKIFKNYLSDDFIYDVLIKGIKLKYDPSKINVDFED